MIKKITLVSMLLVANIGFSQSLPFDFSSANQLMIGAEGAEVSIEQDAANDVLQMIGGGSAWDHAKIDFAENLDLSDDANNTITFKIKPINGTGSGNHLLKFEAPSEGGNTELPFTTTGTDWQTITLDFGSGLSNYGKLVIFTDKGEGNSAVDTYFIDDISGGTNGSTAGVTPATAAPNPPARNAWDVVSLYSDAYADLTSNFDAGWCGDGSVETIQIEGNNTAAYKGNNCQGIVFTNGMDITSYTNMHVDVYIEESVDVTAKVFNLKFVQQPGGAALEVNFNAGSSPALVAGSWLSIDVPVDLATFTGFKEFGITAGNLKNQVWYDNLYIYRAATASVSDNELLNVSMYPNPASSKLNISAASTIKNASIFNVLGKKVMRLEINKNSESIDVSSLASGIYLVKYELDNAAGTAKFIKE